MTTRNTCSAVASCLAALSLLACGAPSADETRLQKPAPSSAELPLTAKPKPNVMLLVDKSGSMDLPLNENPDCGSCSGDACPQDVCPTRWAQMRQSMEGFFSDPAQSSVGRFGLAMFPEPPSSGQEAPSSCNPTETPRHAIPDIGDQPDALHQQGEHVYAAIAAIQSPGNGSVSFTATGGGTPTSRSLAVVGALPSLNADDDRDDVVVLLTDGYPNCNPDNAADYSVDPEACQCTLFSGGAPACGVGGYERVGCSDGAASVDAVRSLLVDRNIRTVVMGFGAEMTSGQGAEILNAMAAVGGFARRCDSAGSCGANDVCVTETVCGGNDAKGSGLPCTDDSGCSNGETCAAASMCGRKYFAANDSVELSRQLDEVARTLQVDTCVFPITATEKSRVIVKVDGTVLQSGEDTWLQDEGSLTFVGSTCDNLRSGTAEVSIQIIG